MANVKTQYGEITRKAKESREASSKASLKTPAAMEEARIAAKFRQRARSDYRTVGHTGTTSSREHS